MKGDHACKTMTVEEAAQCLGLSRNTAYQGVRTGAIPAIRVGRRILIPTHALESLLASAKLQELSSSN